ncbi:MAG: alpha/beta hydrolase [Chloroflexi bacterium]|nr:alpha/beta hydrolase [Chloroflexota bacterium]|tara:strand:- start:28523 stop:29377 length:855 start_codon:yes stop_codon:yes gene_type:complete
MRNPINHLINVGECNISLFEWEGVGPPLFFSHATGFHARVWDNVIRKLPGRHVYSIDLRGHGRSDKTPLLYDWEIFVNDVIKIFQKLNLSNVVGVGHSMGGHTITAVAAQLLNSFKGLVLCDPSIFPLDRYAKEPREGIHPVSKRRNIWSSPLEMHERLKSHKNFINWEDDALWDYCKYGLIQIEGQTDFKLACPPLAEAEMYDSLLDPKILKSLPGIDIPVKVLRAKPRKNKGDVSDFDGSITWPEISDHFPDSEDIILNHCSHFIPMEDSDSVVNEIIKILK